jgi:protein Shroom
MTFQEELMMRLDRKLVVLKAEQEAVREEGEMNEALGARVTARISAVARPPEASKYRLHVEEVGKITSLLLGLSGRLARAENALYGMPADHAERVSAAMKLSASFFLSLLHSRRREFFR